jgi:hypothetical protein
VNSEESNNVFHIWKEERFKRHYVELSIIIKKAPYGALIYTKF